MANELIHSNDADQSKASSTQFVDVQRSVPIGIFFEHAEGARMLALCAEPGMGRTEAINGIVGRAKAREVRVVSRRLRGMDPESATKLIVRLAREVSADSQQTLLALYDVPAGDESCVHREARALLRLYHSGVSVVMSLLPEASQLLEALPECVRVGSRDLLVKEGPSSAEGVCVESNRALTRGIFCLERALWIADAQMSEEMAGASGLPSAYYDALRELVGSSLRLSLTEEELKMRLAMFLLGSGTTSELGGIERPSVRELLLHIKETAPIFGISDNLQRFSCLQMDSRASLNSCYVQLSSACAMFPDVALACADLLTQREDYGRAALICKMVASEDALALAGREGARFLNVGESALVHSFLEKRTREEVFAGAEDAALSQACQAIETRVLGSAVTDEQLNDERFIDATPLEREALMLTEARRMLRSLESLIPICRDGCSPLTRRLLLHREVGELLASGYFSAAMRLLVANPCNEAEPSISASLLQLDFELVRLALGDSLSRNSEQLHASMGFLESSTMEGLASYPVCVEVARKVLSGDADANRLSDALAARAERTGEFGVQAFALVARCLVALRSGAYASAKVTSDLASAQARLAHVSYLERVSAVLGAVSRFLSGEEGVLCWSGTNADDLDAVCVVIDRAMTSEPEAAPQAFEQVLGGVPYDSLWLLAVLSEGVSNFSYALRSKVPEVWMAAVEQLRESWHTDASASAMVDATTLRTRRTGVSERSWQGSRRVEIDLLGRFEVRVDGVPIPDWRLDQRNAKSMLVFLALQSGRSAKRYRIVEQLWPGGDYGSGFNKVYQATSVLRSAIAGSDPSLNPFVLSRASKSIALDADVVCVDVDEFRKCAREAVDCGDPERAVVLAREVENLYEGNLYIPPVDATGFVTAMSTELRTLYADAMVAGADAALCVGERHTAVRLATNAVMADDLREDAVIALVRALKASGRSAEADRQYRSFARRLAHRANATPSPFLSSMMEEEAVIDA